MKLLKQHLIDTDPKKTNKFNKNYKPVNRASAIFPFLINEKLDLSILLMGYWFLKRNIIDIKLVATFRDINGSTIKRNIILINNAKPLQISVKKNLKNIIKKKKKFQGSIEIEIFSSENLFYPFPALVANFNSKNSSSFVHSLGRTFNNLYDKQNAIKFKVPETGFDILPGKDTKPFMAFTNGNNILKNQTIKFKIISEKNQIMTKFIKLKKIKPYETNYLFFLNDKEKEKIKGKSTVFIYHNFNNFFPRFLGGNFKKDESCLTPTHTYFDLQNFKTKDHYLVNQDYKKYYGSYVAIPVFFEKNIKTELAIYPNSFIKSSLNCSLEFFNKDGNLIFKTMNFLKIKKNYDKPIYLNIEKIFYENFEKNKNYKNIHCRFSFSSKNIPLRLKVGLNIIKKTSKNFHLPSNVCFNTIAHNHLKMNKKETFRWFPIINKRNSQFIISNISPVKKGFRSSNIILKFWREKDNRFVKKKITIRDNGFYWFKLNKNKTIKSFLKSHPGWVTVDSDNPFVDGFYFEDNENGIFGADHIF